MLIQKLQHPQLWTVVDALKVRASVDGLTFTVCANHLSAQVSELPDPAQVWRRVLAASISPKGSRKGSGSDGKRIHGGGTNPDGKRNGIYMPDGSVWNGFNSDWDELSKEDRQTVIDTRASNKAKGGRGRKISEVSSGGNKSLKEITTQVATLKRKLAALKVKTDGTAADSDEDVPDNDSDSFGGCQKKKLKKE
jgi:hypothetical protein